MKLTEHSLKPCAIARTLGVIGDNWSLLILRNCFMGVRRFDDFQQQLGLTRHVLTDRLKKLVEHELLKKVPYGEKAGRFEYKLTPKGIDLYPVIMTLANWGNTWMFEEGDEPLVHIHKTCGEITRPVTSCSACGEALSPREVKIIAGKALTSIAEKLDEKQLVSELGYPLPH